MHSSPSISRKAVEFQQAEHRMTGVSCRLLYLHAVWIETYNHTTSSCASRPRAKAYIEGNGFQVFEEQVAEACELMGYDIVANKLTADLVFVYVAPLNEQRCKGSQFETFQAVVAHSKNLVDNEKPMFCFLLGDAGFLPPSKTEEDEHIRSLSDFAISQELAPIASESGYGPVAQFAVEFVPSSAATLSNEFREKTTLTLDSLMNRFGCVGQNLMHQNEKWEFYASCGSVFCHGEDDLNGVTHPSEEDTLFWLRKMKGKACDHCFALSEKLSKCSKCRDAMYCSRDCQKAAWMLHKRLCGKPVEEMQVSHETTRSSRPS